MADLPDALMHWPSLQEQLGGRDVALFLDYDGTLSPIAERPELATLDPSVRDVIRSLASKRRVAIVTGRGLASIRGLVGLPGLRYASNHGFEIVGPDVHFEADPTIRPTFELVAQQLQERVGTVSGVTIESKGFSVAVHYRLTPEDRVASVEAAVDAAVAQHEGVRKAPGKKVFELRPTMVWHKGKAVEWLIAQSGSADLYPIFIGDDRTDEDALVAVRDRGLGIFVGSSVSWDTAARYKLDEPAAVHSFLRKLDALWH